MRLPLLFLLLLVSAFLQAQESRNQIKLSPFRLIDPVNPGIELSYERLHAKRLSAQVSAAYLTPLLFSSYKNFTGYRIAGEEKYFTKATNKAKTYVAAEMVFNNVRFTGKASAFDSATNRTIVDTVSIRRKTIALNLKWGKQYFRKRFVVDISFGLGVKYRNVRHSDSVIPLAEPKEYNIVESAKTAMKNWTINLPVNLKLGYCF